MFRYLLDIVGFDLHSTSHTERLVSGAGAFLGIFLVYFISRGIVGNGSGLIIASMGASAVLLFAVPHGNLSQPWPLLGGHILSAIIGVTCAKLLGNALVSASLAVGVAVTVMYYARCIHPPGGATALVAVIGGPSIHELGYQFVIAPVLLNALILLAVALAFNALFGWRSYPAYLSALKIRAKNVSEVSSAKAPEKISHEDFVYALSEIDTIIDASESDLLRIYDLATSAHQRNRIGTLEPKVGRCYSNGEFGSQWSVRQITARKTSAQSDSDVLDFLTVAGQGRRKTGNSTVDEFLRWAQYEVYRDEDNWRRVVDHADADTAVTEQAVSV